MVDELYHHGVKGQSWGKQNGPPYPLYRKSAYYKKTGKRPPGYTGDKKGKSDSGSTNKSGKIGGLSDLKRAGGVRGAINTAKNARKNRHIGSLPNENAKGNNDHRSDLKQKILKDTGYGNQKAKIQNKGTIGKSGSSFEESAAKKTIKEKLISRYEKQALAKGLSSSEAKKYANKKYEATMKGLKTAAIGLGVAAAATLAYKGARYYKNNYVDEIYKPGTKIQTLSRNPNRQTNETFYGAHRIQDKLQYRGMANNLKGGVGWHRSKDGTPPKIYRLQSELTSTAKVASNNNARKVFNDLRKTDPEFRAYTDNLKTNFDIQKRGRLRYLKKTDAYGAFNRDGLMYGTGDPKQNTKFFNAMKKKGYAGIKDINDRQLNTYHTDANIWFGKSEGYTPKMRQLKTVDADYGKNAKRMMAFNAGRRVAINALTRGGVVVGAGALGGADIIRRRKAVELSLLRKRKKKQSRRRK